jgi:hypothetical protein
MSQVAKQQFRRMNQDADVRSLKGGEYRKLLNGICVQPKSSTVAIDDAITNLYGNAVIANADLGAGTNKVIGGVEDRAGGRYIFFIQNNTASLNTVYQYKDGVITRVFRSALLDFEATDFIDADVLGDILVFTNNRTDIYKLNIVTAIAGGIYTPNLDEILLIKRPPKYSLTPSGGSSMAQATSGDTYQFYYRYVYDDYETSVLSPASGNVFLLPIDAMTVSIPASELSILNSTTNVIQVDYYAKKNGGTEISLFTSEIRVAGPFVGTVTFDGSFKETLADSESFKWNDSIPLSTKALKFVENKLFLWNNREGFTSVSDTVPITMALSSSLNVFGDCLHQRGVYDVGIMFFDFAGRHDGVHKSSNGSVIVPGALADGYSYYMTWDLTVAAANPLEYIPEWAETFAIVRTKDTQTSFFIKFLSPDLFFYKEDGAGVITYNKSPWVSTNTGVAIDISVLTKYSIGYTFQAGDRVILKLDAGTVLLDEIILKQAGKFIYCKRSGSVTPSVGAFTISNCEIYTPSRQNTDLFYEIGTASVANRYAIDNAGTPSRQFSQLTGSISGGVSSNSRKTYNYTGVVSNTLPDSNVLDDGSLAAYRHYEMMSISPVSHPTWIESTHRSVVRIPQGSIELNKRNYLRWSGEYSQNSFFNGLSTFGALDEQAIFTENGPGTALALAGQILVAIHEIESTAVYVGQAFIQTGNSNSFLAQTQGIIGDTQKYLGGHGSIHQASVVSRNGVVYFLDSRKGVIVRRSQDGLTAISEQGVMGLVSALCTAHTALGANSRIIAGWDPQYDCYVISFINTTGPSGYSLYWFEKKNSWVCTTDLKPEFLGQLGTKQLAFLSGALWEQTIEANYNNFFGVQYNRTLEFEIAPLGSLEKIWEAVEIDVENIYSTAGTNEDILLLYHTPGGTVQNRINYMDFKNRGSAWWSSLFRNLNDASMASTTESKYKSSHNTRGQSAYITIVSNRTDKNAMKSISVFFRPSMNTSP